MLMLLLRLLHAEELSIYLLPPLLANAGLVNIYHHSVWACLKMMSGDNMNLPQPWKPCLVFSICVAI